MKKEVIEKLASLITAAFGLVAALAWNDAIQKIFKEIFGEASSIPAMLMYAIIITIVAVIATIWVGKAAEKTQDKGLKDVLTLYQAKRLKDKSKNAEQKKL